MVPHATTDIAASVLTLNSKGRTRERGVLSPRISTGPNTLTVPKGVEADQVGEIPRYPFRPAGLQMDFLPV